MLKHGISAVTLAGLVVGLGILAPQVAQGEEKPGSVKIYRDTYSVPYIYGGTDADAAYGLGYAQAADRHDDIYLNVRTAIGRMSEVLGKDYVQSDYVMQMVGNATRSEAYWPNAPEALQKMGDGFIRGVQAYEKDHNKTSSFALELKPWHSLAIMRAMILNWPLGAIRDEMSQDGNTLGWGSNEWAVSPGRSAENCAILLTDPHLTWQGMSVFYEANVYGDVLAEQHGYFIVGTYMLGYGHTEHFGWAPTTGGPDTADVYAMKLNPDNPMQYEYDGEWMDATVGQVTIPVKEGDPITMPTYTTHLGPAFSQPDLEKQTILVGATPYLDQTALLEQSYKSLQAKDVHELMDALAMNQYMEQNLMSADRDGNIAYIRTGRTPIRPEGWDWSSPVPGNTSKTKWLGIHPAEDLVQIKNPAQGYMQNCNISPAYMMEDSPLQPEKYPDYIYHVQWDLKNSRGDRALQVLSADDSLTKEEAIDLAFDITDPYAAHWLEALRKMCLGPATQQLQEAAFKADMDRLLAWDGRYHKDSTAATLMRYFRLEAFKVVDPEKVNKGLSLTVEEYFDLVKALETARETMTALYGTTEKAWGEIMKVGRGDQLFPTSGVDYGGGEGGERLRTLLSLGVKETEKGSGEYVAHKGSMAMLLMFMHKDGIESYSCIPWGQSSDPKSPHYMDQGKELFSERKFKPVYRTKDALMKNVISQQTLKTNGA